ncbi:hypothetical protein [Streptomyces sp. NPDC007905]|uniref:hypothetical protein n=1 Tax=Streptomyces sp. NPDC007905 TaxID=3364788 RepID=UPI0036E24DC3
MLETASPQDLRNIRERDSAQAPVLPDVPQLPHGEEREVAAASEHVADSELA